MHETPEAQLRAAIAAAGLAPPETVTIDGRIHRFPSNGKRGDDSGWYVLYDGPVVAGAFGCWRSGLNSTFRANSDRHLTAEDHAALELTRALLEQAQAEEAERAAIRAAAIWDAAPPAETHPYLENKKIQAHATRLDGDKLLLPLIDGNGEVRSVQRIAPDGSKKFHPGVPVRGLCCPIGAATPRIYLAEGFATAASIHEATGCRAVAAFSASNLPDTAAGIRTLFPDCELFVVADNDPHGVGLRYATQAAEFSGGRVLQVPDGYGDANDYAAAGHNLAAILTGERGYLESFEEFTREPRPIRWLIRGLIPAESLMMVFGPSGGGKTFVVLDWALSIASGLPDWQGAKINQGPIVYLAGEGHAGLRLRGAAWKHHQGLERFENAWISRSGCDLNTPSGLALTRQAIADIGTRPALIVVDTLHRFLHGDENSAEDARGMIAGCNALQQEYGCTVLLVHHTGHGENAQDRARGSSSWRGALEADILVSPVHGGIRVIRKKMKDIPLDESPVALELQTVVIPGWLDEDGQEVSSAVVIPGAPIDATKTDNKLAEFRNILQNACMAGCDIVEDSPYISRSALKQYLQQNEIFSASALRKNLMTQSTELNRRYFLPDLLRAGDIRPHDGGYLVLNPVIVSAVRFGMATEEGAR